MKYDETMLKNAESAIAMMDHWSLDAFAKLMADRGYDYSNSDWQKYIKDLTRKHVLKLPEL